MRPVILRRAPVRSRCNASTPARRGVSRRQVAVFLAYATNAGHAFIDRDLYLPKVWAADAGRRRACGVPQGVEFATKPELARRMVACALDAGSAGGVGGRRRGLWAEP